MNPVLRGVVLKQGDDFKHGRSLMEFDSAFAGFTLFRRGIVKVYDVVTVFRKQMVNAVALRLQ